MNRVDAFLELVVKQQASDLHLISGYPPRIRIHGEIAPVKYRSLSAEETLELLHEIMPQRVRDAFERDGNTDFAYMASEELRFRVNVFRHLGGVGAVFRTISSRIRSLDELRMPAVLKALARNYSGLVLVTGPTGSGKTTTLTAMVDLINRERKGHIITIEDPIEYVHDNRLCLVSQREVHTHAESFGRALRSALREDPDVILVGEMRDLETIRLAITAAEMGILVLATLHTSNAASTVERIINVFPPEEEPYIRSTLSTSLCGVVSQQLVRKRDGRGRTAAVEILINNAAVSNIIREGNPSQLENAIQSGGLQGMQSMDAALHKLLDADVISAREAYRHAHYKEEFATLAIREDPSLVDEI
ncbi:MAG TPA: type IV pilus twitching motility protein PilT [Thiotrichales bacterium]|nr:type IV pilus twitching motility protein PilT [Thiotrichales bacterium]